jgi:ribosomal protein S18 acetylase RimI-like enzyme
MAEARFQIRRARSTEDFRAVTRLFGDYAASLGVDLGYQDFAAEVANLPGKYRPPNGELFVGLDVAGEGLGCVALRPMADGDCEMKRLYVAPAARGLGLGRALVAAVVLRAREIGYSRIKLDTLPEMEAALAVYRRAGFAPIARYYDTPVAGTVFLGLAL